MVTFTLPSMSVAEAIATGAFPEFDSTVDTVTLTYDDAIEGTLHLEQLASEWSGADAKCGLQIQVDDDDVDVDGLENEDDMQFKLVGDWPAYSTTGTTDKDTFDTATFVTPPKTLGPDVDELTGTADGDTITDVENAANPLRRLLRADMSEDIFGDIDSFGAFGNQTTMNNGFGTVISELETKVADQWLTLSIGGDDENGNEITNSSGDPASGSATSTVGVANASATNPGRHMFEQIMKTAGDESPHAGLTILVTNLQAPEPRLTLQLFLLP
jgi:hypothetical protein